MSERTEDASQIESDPGTEEKLQAELRMLSTEPFQTGYGMWAGMVPLPSGEEIEENRREMFRSFVEDGY